VSLFSVVFWSFAAGFALGVVDAVTNSPFWRWLIGG
jgi:hypothetical protein